MANTPAIRKVDKRIHTYSNYVPADEYGNEQEARKQETETSGAENASLQAENKTLYGEIDQLKQENQCLRTKLDQAEAEHSDTVKANRKQWTKMKNDLDEAKSEATVNGLYRARWFTESTRTSKKVGVLEKENAALGKQLEKYQKAHEIINGK
ncbi:hypothetical protein BDV96DRAFT_600610 [Lophiotrema nucula]|uniref:Uncharacterized protein n=1 Tax=Lophiotrema nucula TaxID=690887 RepID=A0A6A5Z6K4_9PLEO|nr:hypothetical protein BDV96DRAFT_600610 [Lophiotrema nucula]